MSEEEKEEEQEEDYMRKFEKETVYALDEDGNVVSKKETLSPKGRIEYGTGAKGKVRAVVDVAKMEQEELDRLAEKVAETWKTLKESLGEDY